MGGEERGLVRYLVYVDAGEPYYVVWSEGLSRYHASDRTREKTERGLAEFLNGRSLTILGCPLFHGIETVKHGDIVYLSVFAH